VKAVERAKKEGNEAFASGNYLNAIECYTAALSADVNEEVRILHDDAAAP